MCAKFSFNKGTKIEVPTEIDQALLNIVVALKMQVYRIRKLLQPIVYV